MFVVLGGLLTWKWPRVAWLHVPAALWGAAIEFAGWICPLTPLENALRRAGGQSGYEGGFVERYILPLLYPGELTRPMQFALGGGVVVINVLIYAWAIRRHRRRRLTSSARGR
ncbi:MAG: DUF2784 domain-containing protein [Planctomycetes bacterium]|nr:DUF2784 domain-containing protein [Planctomycetota bacterium]